MATPYKGLLVFCHWREDADPTSCTPQDNNKENEREKAVGGLEKVSLMYTRINVDEQSWQSK